MVKRGLKIADSAGMAGELAPDAVGTLRPESFAPPGYAGPVVPTVKSTETKEAETQQADAVREAKPRRSLPLPDLPWRGLAIAAAIVAVCGGIYYGYLRPPSQAAEVRDTIKNYETAPSQRRRAARLCPADATRALRARAVPASRTA